MRSIKRIFAAAALAAATILASSTPAQAQQTWQATLGAQSKDMGRQAIAFLPNEMWIHEGDTINWTSQSGDIHTVSFFVTGQKFMDFTVGCPGFTPSGTNFNGVNCVSAPPLVQGQTYAVKFPLAGNYNLICLVHNHMTGVIHVMAKSAKLPHDQAFYTELAEAQTHKLLSDVDHGKDHGEMDDMLSMRVLSGKNSVVAGIGEMNATAAGFQSLSVVRFLKDKIEVHVGDTVEWSVLDPALPHTITFGTDPANPGPPSANVSFDKDGAGHATLHFVGDSATSGIMVAQPQNQTGVPVSPLPYTVFRVTFEHAGSYKYFCALHDNLGMVANVTVLP